MQTAWRIVHQNHISGAFSGEGARLGGGRWNSEGFAVVYAAESLSLALFEIIVHLEFKAALKLYKAIPVNYPETIVEILDPSTLPEGWNTPHPHPSTLLTGNHWIRQGSSAILQVPSAIVPIESNLLINPVHPDFQALEIGDPIDLPLDPRVLEKLK